MNCIQLSKGRINSCLLLVASPTLLATISYYNLKTESPEKYFFIILCVQCREGEGMSDLQDKIAIVTGANSGIGMATVKALSDKGATVIMLCRSEKRGRKALAELTGEKNRKLDLMICDLGDFASIRSFVRSVKAKYPRIDILVNNAGFISLDRQETKDGMNLHLHAVLIRVLWRWYQNLRAFLKLSVLRYLTAVPVSPFRPFPAGRTYPGLSMSPLSFGIFHSLP